MGVGIIFIMILIVVGAYLLILGIIAYLFLPFLIKEWKSIIELYFNMKLKDALFRHLIHLLFFIPIILFLLFVASNFDVSYLYMFSLVVFLGSSFFGFYIFLYFLFAIHQKNIKKVVIALFLGGAVFIFFAPSGYYLFLPIYNYLTDKEVIPDNMSAGEKERIDSILQKQKKLNIQLGTIVGKIF